MLNNPLVVSGDDWNIDVTGDLNSITVDKLYTSLSLVGCQRDSINSRSNVIMVDGIGVSCESSLPISKVPQVQIC